MSEHYDKAAIEVLRDWLDIGEIAASEILDAVAPLIAAKALRDAATYWGENPDAVDDETPADARNWLRDRADEIERGRS